MKKGNFDDSRQLAEGCSAVCTSRSLLDDTDAAFDLGDMFISRADIQQDVLCIQVGM